MRARLTLAAALVAIVSMTAQAPRSGLDPSGFDPGVRPQDDLFRYVNGGWLDRTAMPDDRVSYTAFMEIGDEVEVRLRDIIEAEAKAARRSQASQQIVDLYTSMMDEARVDELGAAPIEAELSRIASITTPKALATRAGVLSSIAAGGPFSGTVGVDPETRQMVAQIFPGGTLLPDRDYYVNPGPPFSDVRRQYVAYLTRIFTLVRWPSPADAARAVLDLETTLARLQWPAQGAVGGAAANGRYTWPTLAREMPGFDWTAWAAPQGLDRLPALVFAQPSFFRSFAALVPTTPLATWKAWLCSRYVTAVAPYVSRDFDLARFEFFGRALTGQTSPRPRWKRAVGLVSQYLGDALGRLYVERHVPPIAKARVERLTGNIVKAFRQALDEAAWMSAPARREATAKISRLTTRIGYPSRWREYRALEIAPDDLVGNVRRAMTFEDRTRMALARERRDTGEWLITPQTLNAAYSAATNTIVVPAALLQPPIFSLEADEAVNYGAIGAIIGHEIAHAFDQNGRRFDAVGRVREWWRQEDVEGFGSRERALVAQFGAIRPMPGVRVNGELTLAENLADLGGLAIAYRAYRISLEGRPAPTIDGFTGEQRFFLGWAQMWRGRIRDDYLRQWLVSTRYAPPQYRANQIVRNLPAFHEAFGLEPGDRLYLEPQRRVSFW